MCISKTDFKSKIEIEKSSNLLRENIESAKEDQKEKEERQSAWSEKRITTTNDDASKTTASSKEIETPEGYNKESNNINSQNNQENAERYSRIMNNLEEYIESTNPPKGRKSKKGRPPKIIIFSEDMHDKIFTEWLNKLWMKLNTRSDSENTRSDSENAIIARSIKLFPDIYMKAVTSKANYKTKDYSVYITSWKKASSIFTTHYGRFNDNDIEECLEFTTLKGPSKRLDEIISAFESAYCFISKGFLKSLRDQLEIRTKASMTELSKFYKMNSWYRFICKIVITKLAYSEDEKHKKICETLSKLQNFCVY